MILRMHTRHAKQLRNRQKIKKSREKSDYIYSEKKVIKYTVRKKWLNIQWEGIWNKNQLVTQIKFQTKLNILTQQKTKAESSKETHSVSETIMKAQKCKK